MSAPGRSLFGLLLALSCTVAPVPLSAQTLVRTAATSLRFPAAPPTFGYTTENAFAAFTFNQPVAIVTPPGETDRIFVAEKPGRIWVITNLATTPTRSVFLDLTARVGDSSSEQGLLALAFHPNFAANGQFFVWFTTSATTAAGTGQHDRLARFTVTAGNPATGDLASETPLISQRDEAGNHNGGELQFGADGYLYLSMGDEGGGNDQFNNSQRIDRDFFSGMIRIDVDRKPGSLAPNAHAAVHAGTYTIPADNPWVGATSFNGSAVTLSAVRTEFWAVGLRNPWRWSFDRATGELWLGDVGQDAREEIDLITRGANYGWSYREGTIAGPRANPPAAASFTAPVYDYNRTAGQTVTGGLVYRGAKLSQLYGAYVFCDYSSGRIWSLRRTTGAPQVDLLATDGGIVSFGVHPTTGDILLADIAEGRIKRLVYNATPTGSPLPVTLTETGAFTNVATLATAPGVVSYTPNVNFWSDHAKKRRWFAVPNTTDTFGFSADGNWSLPTGAVWMKHFDLETTRGNAATSRRIETRFLVKTATGVYGASYRWNDAQTEATLVAEDGADQNFTITENGVPRTQTWHYPSRAECLACHTPQGGHALSFNTRQLNRDHAFPGGTGNIISVLAQSGYLAGNPPAPSTLRALAPADDTSKTVELRARSYLDANCAQCHQPGGSANGLWDARLATDLNSAGIVNGPLVNNGGDAANRVLVPGDATHTRMLQRISGSGATRMPPLGTNERDLVAEQLLRDWITVLGLPATSRVGAVSARADAGSGSDTLTGGFIVTGGNKTVLVRGLGPVLTSYGVPGAMPSPTVKLFSGTTELARNTRWNSAANAAEIRATTSRIGLSVLPEGGADSALLATLAPGAYTAQVAPETGGNGVALVEVYDADAGPTPGRLLALSVRARVGTGDKVLIPGVLVGAGTARTLLIRAVGPGLTAFGVTGVLEQPTLTVYSGTTPLATNTRWNSANNATDIRAAAVRIGLPALAEGGADSALLVRLNEGAYTIQVSGVGGSTGVALVEAYEAE